MNLRKARKLQRNLKYEINKYEQNISNLCFHYYIHELLLAYFELKGIFVNNIILLRLNVVNILTILQPLFPINFKISFFMSVKLI